jgi:TonB family protein
MQIGKQSGMLCVAALVGISLMSDAAAQKQKQRTEHHRLAKPNGLHAAKPYGAGLNEEDSLRALESEISRKLGSNIQESDYPEDARRQGWSGTALIAVLVASNGKIKDVSIQQTSGFPSLDSQALRMVGRVNIWWIPQRLRSREVRVTVPVGFYIRDI